MQFIRNVTTLMTGTLVSQVMGLLLVPIVARLFTPEHFGVAALFLSLVSMLSLCSSLCYSEAILLPKEKYEAIRIVKLCFVVVGIVCFLLFVFFFSYAAIMPTFKWVSLLGGWIYLIPIGVFLNGTISILRKWNIRKTRYRTIASSEVVQSISTPTLRIGAGILIGSNAPTLILTVLISYLGAVLVLGKNLGRELKAYSSVKSSELIVLAKKYKEFPLYSMPSGFVTSIASQMPVYIFAYYYSPAVIGYYAMANRVVQLPLAFALNSVRDVYLQNVSELLHKRKPQKQLYIRTTAVLIGIGIVPFSIIFFFGGEIFYLALGEKWGSAGEYAGVLSPWLFTNFILVPSNGILILMKENKFRFFYQIVATSIKFLAFFVAVKQGLPPLNVLMIFSITSSLLNIGIMIKSYDTISKSDKLISNEMVN